MYSTSTPVLVLDLDLVLVYEIPLHHHRASRVFINEQS